jgi:RHS repeat-associated protein
MRRAAAHKLLSAALVVGAFLMLGGATSGALAAARATGDEVPGFENEYTKVFENADGSYAAELHTVPINFRNADGNWQTIDPTLVSAPGGWKNTAGPSTISFASSAQAPGGDLVSIQAGAKRLGFAAASPSALAGAPIVLSNTISYPDIYPGISLLYTLERNELKEELILTEKPRVSPTIRFPLSLTGLTASKQPNGEITLVDADGKTLFTIPRLTMTDSSGPNGLEDGTKTDAIDYSLSTIGGKQTLTITPDWNWLRDSRRVYPVSVDPVVNLMPSTGTFVRSDLSTPQSGATTYEVGTSNGGSTIARTLVTYNLSSLQGVTVSAATLTAWESWSASCTASQVNTYQVTSSWDSSVIWSTQPTVASTPIDSAIAAQGFSGSCPQMRITLADATTAVQNWLSGTWTNNGFEVKAASESDSNGFKKFASDFSLYVTYNVTMTPPTGLSPADGTLSSNTTPLLIGTFPGPGIGYNDYEVRRSSDGVIVATGAGPTVNANQASNWTVPSGKLVSGNSYSWRARSRTSSDSSAWTSSRTYIADQAPTGSIHSPTSGSTVASVNPDLRVTGSDPDGNPIYTQFQVSTNNIFTNIVADSGWMPTTWTYTVPDDTLHNDIRSTSGVTYYWRVRAKDTLGATSGWATSDFALKLSLTGVGGNWPTFSRGPISVNEATGNLVVQAPGPSYPTIVGPMGLAPTFNSFNTANTGLGVGWSLGILDLRGAAPKLVDHSVLTGTQKQDAVELVGAHGNKRWFNHVSDTAIYTPPHGQSGAVLSKNGDGTWTLTDLDGTIATYTTTQANAVAKLTAVEYADVKAGIGALTYSFVSGSDDKLQTITDPAGRTLSLTWNSVNPAACPSPALLCVTGPDGVTWKYNASGGRLSGVNDGTRDLVTYTYANGNLTKVKNPNDLNPGGASPGYDATHSVQLTYDGTTRVNGVVDGPIHSQPAGQQTSVWTFNYLGSTNLAATRAAHAGLPQGTVRTASGRTEIAPPKQFGQPTPKKNIVYYDGQGQPMQTTDILGNVTMSAYNSRGDLLWTEDADGNPSDNTWDTVNDLLIKTQGPDPDGAGPLGRPSTDYRYDEQAIGTAMQPGAGLQGLQASYFPNFNLAGRPAARQTDGTVDFSWGTGGPAALGTQHDTFAVRWTGNVSVATEGDYTFTTVSDEGVRLTVDGIQAIHKWNDQMLTSWSALPIHLTPGLHPITLDYYEKYDSAEVHLRWSCPACSPAIADQVIPATSLQPAWGNQTSTVSPLGKVTFSHVADPATTLADYSLVEDGLANVITSYAYDDYGRATQKVMPKGNAARTIDANGNLQGSADTAYATSYVYYAVNATAAPPAACGGGSAVNQAGLLASKTPYGLASSTFVYNSRGEQVALTNGAGSSCSTFTNEGRLATTKAPGESQSTTYAYDPAGVVRTATDASGTLTTEYDEAGRVTRSVDSFGAEATFSYDLDGNQTRRSAKATSTGTNYQTNYAYDDADRLASVTDPANRQWTFFYDTRSNLKATQYPNGTFFWSDYNLAGWQTALYNRHGTLSVPLPGSVPSDASPIADYAYSYELEGRKTQEVRTGGGLTSETSSYVYDDLGRLSQVTLPDGIVRVYGFDLDSNRSSIIENGLTVATYAYDPNKLDELASVTQGATTNYNYTSDGQVSAKGSDSLAWDGRGRHTGGSFAGTNVSYAFDAGGFRRLRTGAGATSHYRLGGLYETNTSGTILSSDTAGLAGDLAHYAGAPATGTAVSFLYYNGHGDLAAETDTTGTRTAADTYDPFGALRSGTAPANATSERWTGRFDKKLDSASSLIEMGVRPYDPSLGRFLSRDRIDGGSPTGYDYAGQDPVNGYDLSGECYKGTWSMLGTNMGRFKRKARRDLCRRVNLKFEECLGMSVMEETFSQIGDRADYCWKWVGQWFKKWEPENWDGLWDEEEYEGKGLDFSGCREFALESALTYPARATFWATLLRRGLKLTPLGVIRSAVISCFLSPLRDP